MDFFSKYKRTLIICFGILTLLIVGWVLYYNILFFHITGISPNPHSASYLSPRLVVTFNKDLKSDSAQVSSSDATVSASVSGKQLIIALPSNLEGNKTYVITINTITSKNGDVIKDHVISLQTVLNSDSLSEADKNTILNKQQENKSPAINDPIFSYLPYSTLDFSLDTALTNGEEGQKAITIKIKITLSAADATSDSAGAVARYHQEAIDYLDSLKGIDLNNYEINETVINPTL